MEQGVTMRFYKAKKPPSKRMHPTAPVGARVSAVLPGLRWVWWRTGGCILRRGGSRSLSVAFSLHGALPASGRYDGQVYLLRYSLIANIRR